MQTRHAALAIAIAAALALPFTAQAQKAPDASSAMTATAGTVIGQVISGTKVTRAIISHRLRRPESCPAAGRKKDAPAQDRGVLSRQLRVVAYCW